MTPAELGKRNTKLFFDILTNTLLTNTKNNKFEVENKGYTTIITLKEREFYFRLYISSKIQYMVKIDVEGCHKKTDHITYCNTKEIKDQKTLEETLKTDFESYIKKLIKLGIGIWGDLNPEDLLIPMVYNEVTLADKGNNNE